MSESAVGHIDADQQRGDSAIPGGAGFAATIGNRSVLKQLIASGPAAAPLRALGHFFAMVADTFAIMFTTPFAVHEYLVQCWFVARVTAAATAILVLPWAMLVTFFTNVLLLDIGAGDSAGTGAATFTLTQTAPVITVLVTGGAASTAMCADLGARTIREELDALRVMGINPIQSLVVPRVLALATVSFLLLAVSAIACLVADYIFAVYVQHISPGAFVAGMTVLAGADDVLVSVVKATLFGLTAGLIACYKGISVRGGPAGVGYAVSETVVISFTVLFAVNMLVTAVAIKFTV